jgi:hypothetical protein
MTKHRIDWRKSRHSEPNGECVEVACLADDTIGIRSSRPEASRAIPQLTRSKVARPPLRRRSE